MNSKPILNKLLSKTQNPLQIVGGILGTFLGVLLLSLGVQIFFEYLNLVEAPKNKFGKQYIIINKKVSNLNTISGELSEFNQSDIDLIKKIPSVDNVGLFTANNFTIWAGFTIAGYNTGLKTELFFEAVEDRYIDDIPKDWGWKSGDETIPMILPADYINIYNFTYAPGRGLPLISPSTVKLATFHLKLSGDKSAKEFLGRVVGYSSRLNTILVPKNFLEYANNEFVTKKEEQKIRRLIIEIDHSQVSNLYKLIKDKNWETNENKLMSK